MYYVPEVYSTRNYSNPLSQMQINVIKDECAFREASVFDEDFLLFAYDIMRDHNLAFQQNTEGCLKLYQKLRTEAMAILDL